MTVLRLAAAAWQTLWTTRFTVAVRRIAEIAVTRRRLVLHRAAALMQRRRPRCTSTVACCCICRTRRAARRRGRQHAVVIGVGRRLSFLRVGGALKPAQQPVQGFNSCNYSQTTNATTRHNGNSYILSSKTKLLLVYHFNDPDVVKVHYHSHSN